MTTTINRLRADEMESQLERRERLGLLPEAKVSQAVYSQAVEGWFANHTHQQATKRQIAAAKECGIRPNADELDIELHDTDRLSEIRNSLYPDSPTGGQYIRPGGIIDRLESALADHSAIRSVATVVRTNNAGESYLPILDDATGEGEIIGGEPSTTEGDFTFGASEVGYRLFGSKIAKVSHELFQDGVLRGDRIALALAARVSRIQNRHWTQVRLVPNVNVTVTAGSVTAITYAEILDLVYSLDTAYRESPTCGFMAHGDVGKQLMKMTATDGSPIFRRSADGNGWLHGYRVRFNSHMSAPATTVKSLLFGDFAKALLVADVREMKFKELTERYAETDTLGFASFITSGFSVIQPTTANAIVALVQA